jgi:hypothetical protein
MNNVKNSIGWADFTRKGKIIPQCRKDLLEEKYPAVFMKGVNNDNT